MGPARLALEAQLPVDAQVVAVRVTPRRPTAPSAFKEGAIPTFVVRREAACPTSGADAKETFAPRTELPFPVPNDRATAMLATQDAARIPRVVAVRPQVEHVGLHRLGKLPTAVERWPLQAGPSITSQKLPTVAQVVKTTLPGIEPPQVVAVAASSTLATSTSGLRTAGVASTATTRCTVGPILAAPETAAQIATTVAGPAPRQIAEAVAATAPPLLGAPDLGVSTRAF